MSKYLKLQHIKKWKYELFGKEYNFEAILKILGIIMQIFKSIKLF